MDQFNVPQKQQSFSIFVYIKKQILFVSDNFSSNVTHTTYFFDMQNWLDLVAV